MFHQGLVELAEYLRILRNARDHLSLAEIAREISPRCKKRKLSTIECTYLRQFEGTGGVKYLGRAVSGITPFSDVFLLYIGVLNLSSREKSRVVYLARQYEPSFSLNQR